MLKECNYYVYITLTDFSLSLPLSFSNTVTSSDKTSTTTPPLLDWQEVRQHPGLISAVTGGSSNPVLLLVKPETVLVHELKPLSVKSRIQGTVLVVQQSSNDVVSTCTYIPHVKVYMCVGEFPFF